MIRGSSAIFGRNTLAGALNIITKRSGMEREFVPEFEWGSFGRQKDRGHFAGTEGPIDYYFSGTYFREEGWRDVSEGRIGRGFGKLGYNRDGTDVPVSYQDTRNRIEQPGSLPLSDIQAARSYETFGTFAPDAKLPRDPIEPFLTPALPINVLGSVSYRF